MAKLSGSGLYITFGKPYLQKVADIITAGDPLGIGDVTQKINMTEEIKMFLRHVKSKNENAIASLLKPGTNYNPIFNGYKWTDIDKSQFTGRTGGASGETTAMQERASLFAIQKSIENNGYTDQKKFYELYRADLQKIYPGMDEGWEDTFYQQQLTVFKQVGRTKYRHYSRDDGMMEYMTKISKNMYGVAKKDSWNPADIWLVSDYDRVVQELEKRIKDDTTSIQEFNAVLREMFHDRKIVGISLKKMSGKTALWELVNLEKMDVFESEEYQFSLKSADIDFRMKSKEEFKTSDSLIMIAGKKGSLKFQIRQNSTGFRNLKIEGTDLGATAARLGKVPLPMATSLLRSEGIVFDNDNNNYPKTYEEFMHPVTQNKFVQQWKKIKQYTGLQTEKQFIDNVSAVYKSKRPDFAHSKLMQLDLLSKIFSKSKSNQETILTSMAYLAQKKGSVFGPFGKLY